MVGESGSQRGSGSVSLVFHLIAAAGSSWHGRWTYTPTVEYRPKTNLRLGAVAWSCGQFVADLGGKFGTAWCSAGATLRNRSHPH